jgi:hypothetical protein
MSSNPAVLALMEEIKKRVKSQPLSNKFKFTAQAKDNQGQSAATALIRSEDLEFLNRNWGNWHQSEASSHRAFVGRAIVWAKKRLRSLIFNFVMKDYLESQANFNQALVRYCNNSARYIDAKDMENFWNLIKKIDGDIEATNERVDCLFEELYAELRKLQTEAKVSNRWGDH